MLVFETVNELSLKVTTDGNGSVVYTKAGAFIGGQSMGGKNYQFEKLLLGPQGNPIGALVGQLGRRFTGENLPLMKVTSRGMNELFYAHDNQHVIVKKLDIGEVISVESENILAFTGDCKYGIRFLAQGVISQKGLATSTLKGAGNDAYVAILVDGNPLVLDNTQNGAYITADPDAVVCWTGSDPGFKLDLSWKNLIGQASGESYMFEWTRPASVIIQPKERKSGINIGMDGGSSGQRADVQQGQSLQQAGQGMRDTIGNLLGGQGAQGGQGATLGQGTVFGQGGQGMGGNINQMQGGQSSPLNGLGSMIGNLLR